MDGYKKRSQSINVPKRSKLFTKSMESSTLTVQAIPFFLAFIGVLFGAILGALLALMKLANSKNFYVALPLLILNMFVALLCLFKFLLSISGQAFLVLDLSKSSDWLYCSFFKQWCICSRNYSCWYSGS